MNSEFFKDTQFSTLVRLVSGKKLFRFPDEINPSLWKKSIQTQAPIDSPTSSTEGVETSLPQATLQGLHDVRDKEIDNLPLPLDAINHTVEDGKDIFLIDWYGPDDPEVSHASVHSGSYGSAVQRPKPNIF